MFEKLLTIRTLIGFMVFTATCMSYILRVSFNIAIVTMTDVDTDDNTTTESSLCDNHSDTFRWGLIRLIFDLKGSLGNVWASILRRKNLPWIFHLSTASKTMKATRVFVGPKVNKDFWKVPFSLDTSFYKCMAALLPKSLAQK